MVYKDPKSGFSMKLITGKRIVLVERPGIESQMFIPLLRNNSIVMENLVFNYSAPLPANFANQQQDATTSAPSLKESQNFIFAFSKPRQKSSNDEVDLYKLKTQTSPAPQTTQALQMQLSQQPLSAKMSRVHAEKSQATSMTRVSKSANFLYTLKNKRSVKAVKGSSDIHASQKPTTPITLATNTDPTQGLKSNMFRKLLTRRVFSGQDAHKSRYNQIDVVTPKKCVKFREKPQFFSDSTVRLKTGPSMSLVGTTSRNKLLPDKQAKRSALKKVASSPQPRIPPPFDVIRSLYYMENLK